MHSMSPINAKRREREDGPSLKDKRKLRIKKNNKTKNTMTKKKSKGFPTKWGHRLRKVSRSFLISLPLFTEYEGAYSKQLSFFSYLREDASFAPGVKNVRTRKSRPLFTPITDLPIQLGIFSNRLHFSVTYTEL